MSATAPTPDDPLLPRPPGGMGAGAMLALAVHGALLLALAAGVHWRHQATETFSAELWAALPEVAAPRAVEPTPEPTPKLVVPTPAPAPPTPAPPVRTEAQIAIEKAEREKARKERIEAERAAEARRQREAEADLLRKQRELQAKRDAERQAERQRQAELARQEKARKAEEARLEAQRQENLKRMLGQAQGTGSPTSTGTAARDAAPSAAYGGLLIAHIKPNIVLTDTLPASLVADVEVRASASGTVLSRRIVRSSGNTTWDEAVLRAIDRSGALPRDKDGRVPPSIVISFRPE